MDADAIVDGILAWDRELARRRSIAYMEARLRAPRECGECTKWMKSRECPRERNVNGMYRGPSCGDLVCGQFEEASHAINRRAADRAELARLRGEETPEPRRTIKIKCSSHGCDEWATESTRFGLTCKAHMP